MCGSYCIIFIERRELLYVPHNQNNHYQKCNLNTLGPQKTEYWAASEKNVVIISFPYSLCSVVSFSVWKKNKLLLIVSVSGNRKPENTSWIYMRFWLGCQLWFNSRRPFRDGPAMSTREEMKPPVIKAMHILFTVVASLEFPVVHPIVCWSSLRTVWMCVRQGYASTEEPLGNCVLLIGDTSDVAGDVAFPSTAKLKAALRLLFTKHPT